MQPVLLAVGQSEDHLAILEQIAAVTNYDPRDAPSTSPHVLVVLPDVPQPIVVLQRFVARGGRPEAVLAVPAESVETLRGTVTLSPFVGLSTVVVAASDRAGFVAAVEHALARARASLRLAADLGAIHAQLGGTDLSIHPVGVEALEVQRQFVAALANDTPNGLIAASTDGRIAFWNPAAERLYGIAASEAIGRRIEDLFPPEAADALQAVRRAWANLDSSAAIETRQRLADGELHDVELRPVGLRGPSGALGGALVVRDITSDKQREALRQSFVAVLAHDLRSPLQSVSLGLELLDRRAKNDRDRDLIRRLHRSAHRMNRMIHQLLELARSAQPGGLPLERSEVDFDEVVTKGIEELTIAHPDRAIVLHTGAAGLGLWDGDRLEQIVSNLVGNAVQHGDPARPVTVTTRHLGDAVGLEVHNFGARIPPEDLAEIFEPYRVVSADRGTVGLGLGLHITREFVRAHGGTISVTSDDSGTRFAVRLPR